MNEQEELKEVKKTVRPVHGVIILAGGSLLLLLSLMLAVSLGADNEFTKSETWKSIPAVEKGQVIEFDTKEATYSDPVTLEHLLKIFEEGFLK